MVPQTDQLLEPKVSDRVQITLEWVGEDGKSHRVYLQSPKKNVRALINETNDIAFFNLNIDGKIYTGNLVPADFTPREANLYVLKLLKQFS